MRALICGAVLMAVAGSARAEVRIERHATGQLHLNVRPVASGVWTPRPQQTDGPVLLNPEGDLVGDGYPVYAASNEGLVAAWTSPGNGGLRYATVARGAVRLGSLSSATQPAAVTVALGANGDALVTWWDSSADQAMVAFIDAEGTASESVGLQPGIPLLVFESGDGFEVVSVVRASAQLIFGNVQRTFPQPIPMPGTSASFPIKLPTGIRHLDSCKLDTDATRVCWLYDAGLRACVRLDGAQVSVPSFDRKLQGRCSD